VNGATDMVGAVKMGSTLSVSAATVMGATLSVNGATDVVGAVKMGSTLSVNDAVLMSSTLSVNGIVDLNSNVNIQNKLSIGDSLFVGGATEFGKELQINGATTMGSTLSVNDAVNLENLLKVKGTLSVQDAVVMTSTLSIGNDVTVNQGNTIFANYFQTTTGLNNMQINLGDAQDGTLTINGNLDILGTYNQIPVDVTALQVEDKTITLAVSSNSQSNNHLLEVDSETTNDKSGLVVAGVPDGYTSNDGTFTSNVWDKSFLWNYGGSTSTYGLQMLGPQSSFSNNATATNQENIDNEAFWELKGGSLRLTGYLKDDSGEVEKISYAIRITRNKELQFVKMEEGKTATQVATFGVKF